MGQGMKLTVVGCSGSFAGPESPASCYLLEADHGGRTWRVLLDLGSGALGVLQRFADPLSVDAVLFTHLHPDHYFDISGLYVVWKYHPAGPSRRIPVWGPAGTAAQVARAYGLDEDPGMAAEFDFREYDGQPIELGPLSVHPTPVAHPVPGYALRVEGDGRVLAYSGDSGPCAALSEMAAEADLLLCEAAFVEDRDNPTDLHLTGAQAGEVAAKAGVGALVLTHIPPWHDPQQVLAEARNTFTGRVELAVTGATYTL
jgi:ribonuclease BN (tRNA processing enzyme)